MQLVLIKGLDNCAESDYLSGCCKKFGAVAQLARASDCRSEG
jgi:hypothetical protein